jgi:hypothetical protein
MYDIIFISSSKDDTGFKEFKQRYPLAKHATSASEASARVMTKFYWLVWNDIDVNLDFKFEYEIPEWDEKYIHVFKNGDTFDGVCFLSKYASISDREINNRFFINSKEVDIIASIPRRYNVYYTDSYDEYESICSTETRDMFWIVWNDIEVLPNFTFDLILHRSNTFDKTITHVFKNSGEMNGICLMSSEHKVSKREFESRFFIDKKEYDIEASRYKKYNVYYIDSYDEYVNVCATEPRDMFWVVWNDVEVLPNFTFDLIFTSDNIFDKSITHVFKNSGEMNGICLMSRNTKVSKREFESRFFIDKKEHDIEASRYKKYNVYYTDSYDEYVKICETELLAMFWVVWNDVEVLPDFEFDLIFTSDNIFDKSITHVFKNSGEMNGICLMSRNSKVSKREFESRFFIDKKEHDIEASIRKQYDIVFISYNESCADENYNRLVSITGGRNIYRIRNVNGIHNAHKAAAKLVSTPMFWVVDADAYIVDGFDLTHTVNRLEYDIVHTWYSKNPVNGLEYGYGGVKLLPTHLTLGVETTSIDMTTGISPSFKVMPQVSNVSTFNTDPFTAWRSAFRECVKLSSGLIAGNNPTDNEYWLNVWCSINNNAEYGEYVLLGANSGRIYGEANKDNTNALSRINDFAWLHTLFSINIE